MGIATRDVIHRCCLAVPESNRVAECFDRFDVSVRLMQFVSAIEPVLAVASLFLRVFFLRLLCNPLLSGRIVRVAVVLSGLGLVTRLQADGERKAESHAQSQSLKI